MISVLGSRTVVFKKHMHSYIVHRESNSSGKKEFNFRFRFRFRSR